MTTDRDHKETIQVPIELNEWQLREVEKAVAEADRGDFASDDIVRSVFSKWRADLE